jgi:quercetin dioxygenase-like cupin family protein
MTTKGRQKMELKAVVKKEEALKRTFKGVNLDSLAVGEKSMVTKMNYVVGNFATEHTHPHEQCGYVISGTYRMTVRRPGVHFDRRRHLRSSRECSPFL